MSKIFFIVSVFSLMILFSCNQMDFSNPEEVIKAYRVLSVKSQNKTLYNDFISLKSKELVTEDEFVKTRHLSDSTIKSAIILDSKVYSLPVYVNNSTYKRFKVDEKSLYGKDTIFNRYYYSLINENGKWKVIWTGTLLSLSDKKYRDGNYSEARKILEEIIRLDPFSGAAYGSLAWCAFRDQALSQNEQEEAVVKNAKYALSLEEDNFENYNMLGAYYSKIGNSDLAIQKFEQGLLYCFDNKDKARLYANIVNEYMASHKFIEAEVYIKEAITLNNKNTPVWFTYGKLMLMQNKIDVAAKYFENALKEEKMESSLQGGLYYYYAYCCYSKKDCATAKTYINKALDIEPNNTSYQELYNGIKYCN